MKFVHVFLFVTLISCLATATNIPARRDDHNIHQCKPVETDWKVLLRTTVSVKGSFWQIKEKTISFPENGIGQEVITCIRVTDQIANGKGGYPTILDGGVDFNYVNLKFTSQKSQGFQFFVEIWGKM